MPRKRSKQAVSDGGKSALIGTIITATIGLIGTLITLYIQNVLPMRYAEQRTQTAEMKLTVAHLSATPTFTPAPDTPAPSPTPTMATATPTFVTATLTPSLSPTPVTPTATITPMVNGVKYCVDVRALNVRAGPGVNFNIIGVLSQDECLYFDGYVVLDGLYYWLRISEGQAGYLAFGNAWVYGYFLRPQDFERLPVLTLPPPPVYTPTPAG